MNDEEIMKKFNETFSDERIEQEKKSSVAPTPYRATSNLNTVEQPTISNSANIPPLNSNNSMNNNMQAKIMNVEDTNYTTYEHEQNYESNVSYNYVPSYSSKTKKTISFKMSPEMLSIIIIIAILLIVIMIIPTVYDFFTGL